MIPARTRIARAGYMVLAVLVAAALIAQVILIVRGGADVNSGESGGGVPVGTRLVRLFSYFTIQSNILVLALAVTLALRPDRDGRGWRVLHLDALLGITVTGVVFAAVLAPIVHPTGIAAAVNAAFHYVSPVAVVVGWLVLGPRPRIDGRTVFLALGWPVAWLAYTFAHGAASGWYPYPFLDLRVLDAGTVARNVGFVVVGTLLLSALLWWGDRALPNSGAAASPLDRRGSVQQHRP